MRYGYARVSTKQQDFNSQIEALKREGCDKIYKEKFTATTTDRPQFQELLQVVNAGDTIVITKLDRFARSTNEATTIIKDLFESGVRIHVLNMGIVENTPTGRLIFNVMMSFAEFERDMIVERTKEGRERARQRPDYVEGRPRKFGHKQIGHALTLLESHSYTEVERMTGISKSTLTRAKREAKKAKASG